jgi:hypothetical protein
VGYLTFGSSIIPLHHKLFMLCVLEISIKFFCYNKLVFTSANWKQSSGLAKGPAWKHLATPTSPRLQRGLTFVGFAIHCTNKLELRNIEFI